jgi:MFS family permease
MNDLKRTGQQLLSHTFRALEHRNFRLFFIGQTISWIGTWMQQIALGWLAYKLSNSALWLGVVTFSSQAPTFFLSPFSGAVVDRFNRHKLVIATQGLCMVQATVLAVLTLMHVVQIWQLIVLGIFLGIVNAFDMPGRQAFMVQMVDRKEDLPNAIALNSSLVNAARLIGPTVAGFLIALVGEGMCFLLNAVSYVAVLCALFLMKVVPVSLERRRETDMFSHLKEGWRYAFGSAPIRGLILLLAATNLFGAPYSVLMPVFARDVFHGGAHALGFLMTAAGIGALSGAIMLAARQAVPGLGKWVLASAVIYGLGLICFSLTSNMQLAMVMLVFVGFGMMVQMAATNTMLQTITDEDKRGRVMSLYTMAFMITPFGGLAAGALASHIGGPKTVLICGVLTLLCGLFFARYLPALRKEIRAIYVAKGIIQEQ